eukprot:scaffold123105_cov30-Tisochrysis_lutea.AAC.7
MRAPRSDRECELMSTTGARSNMLLLIAIVEKCHSIELCNRDLLYGAVHLASGEPLGHTVVMVTISGGPNAFHEFLVVGDDNQLEVRLRLPVLDDVVQC